MAPPGLHGMTTSLGYRLNRLFCLPPHDRPPPTHTHLVLGWASDLCPAPGQTWPAPSPPSHPANAFGGRGTGGMCQGGTRQYDEVHNIASSTYVLQVQYMSSRYVVHE